MELEVKKDVPVGVSSHNCYDLGCLLRVRGDGVHGNELILCRRKEKLSFADDAFAETHVV